MLVRSIYFLIIIQYILINGNKSLFAQGISEYSKTEHQNGLDRSAISEIEETEDGTISKKYNFGKREKTMLLWRTSLLFGSYKGVESELKIGYYVDNSIVFIQGIGYLHYSTPFIQPKNWPVIADSSDINQEIWTYIPLGIMYPSRLSNNMWLVPSLSFKGYLLGSSLSNKIPTLSLSGSIDFAVNLSYVMTKHLGLGLDLRLSYGTPLSKAENVQYPGSYTSVGLNCIYFF